MSVQTTAWAWEQPLAADEKIALLALVEFVSELGVATELRVDHWTRLEAMTGLEWGRELDHAFEALEARGYVNQFGWSGESSLVSLLDPTEALTRHADIARPRARKQVEGYVYCMHVPGMKAVKIGLTKGDVKSRARQLFQATGFRHVPVWVQYFEDCHQTERAIHRALDKHRVRRDGAHSEYFALGGVS